MMGMNSPGGAIVEQEQLDMGSEFYAYQTQSSGFSKFKTLTFNYSATI